MSLTHLRSWLSPEDDPEFFDEDALEVLWSLYSTIVDKNSKTYLHMEERYKADELESYLDSIEVPMSETSLCLVKTVLVSGNEPSSISAYHHLKALTLVNVHTDTIKGADKIYYNTLTNGVEHYVQFMPVDLWFPVTSAVLSVLRVTKGKGDLHLFNRDGVAIQLEEQLQSYENVWVVVYQYRKDCVPASKTVILEWDWFEESRNFDDLVKVLSERDRNFSRVVSLENIVE